MKDNFVLILFCFILISIPLCNVDAQINNNSLLPKGTPFYMHYVRGDNYFGSLQTWGVIKDDQGLLLFGNTNYGIQLFDGTHWQQIDTPGNRAVVSLVKTDDGHIFATTETHLGALVKEDNRYRFAMLIPPDTDSSGVPSPVIKAETCGSQICFLTDQVLYRYKVENEAFTKISADDQFIDIAAWDETIWLIDGSNVKKLRYQPNTNTDSVNIETVSISVTEGSTPVALLSGSQLPAFVSEDHQVWKKRKETWESAFTLNAINDDEDLVSNKYQVLSDGALASATSNGVYIWDSDGNLRHHFTKENGLTANFTHNLYEDSAGTLWITTTDGVTGMELYRPMRQIVSGGVLPEEGIQGVAEFNNRVVVAAQTGLFISNGGQFIPKETGIYINNIRAGEEGVWIASNQGLYFMDKQMNITAIDEQDGIMEILQPKQYGNTLFYSTTGGKIKLLEFNESVQRGQKIRELYDAGSIPFSLNIGREQQLWAGLGDRVLALSLELELENKQNGRYSVTNSRYFNQDDGLPANSFNYTMKVRDDVGFITRNGFFRLTTSRDSLIKDTRFDDLFGSEGFPVWPVYTDPEGDIWTARAAYKIGKFIYNPETKNFDWHEDEYTRMAALKDVDNFFYGKSGRIYFQTFNRIAFYDSTLSYNPLPDPKMHITSVSTVEDSLLYSGWGTIQNNHIPEYSYQTNSLRFTWALIDFKPQNYHNYQFKMEGADSDWSGWSGEISADYRNLREGTYRFLVRGRDIYNRVSTPVSFQFTVLAPWHRTMWAYGVYLMLLLGLVAGAWHWRNQKLLEQQKKLEAQVQERTSELKQKKEQLEKLDRIKTTFFSNVSHEFRTPLTLIKGPAEQILADQPGNGENRTRQLKKIIKNSDRLLSLIDQILELTRMESGTYILQLQQVDLIALTRRVAQWHRQAAAAKNLNLRLDLPDEEVIAWVDVRQMELLVSNLISNAIKYTRRGEVSIQAQHSEKSLDLVVSDTGLGMAKEEQKKIFNRYYRGERGKLSVSGSGIGLNLVKFVADLHGADLHVESEVGYGTSISVQIPTRLKDIPGEYRLLRGDDEREKSTDVNVSPENDSKTAHTKEHGFQNTINVLENGDMIPDKDIPLVLIADDTPDIRTFIKDTLGENYRYIECADGRSAVEQAQKYAPDIILMDVMMPMMDGFTACREIKKQNSTSHIPVILITAKGSEHNELSGLKSGADDYITKPFAPSILKARVSGQLRLLERLRDHFKKQLIASEESKIEPQPPKNVADNKTEKSDREWDKENNIDKELQDIMDEIEKHLHDPDFDVTRLAETLGRSRTSLYRQIKNATGQTLQQFIRERRMEKAMQLLEERQGSVSEVAYSVGFNSASYFTRVFKSQYNKLPSELKAG